MKKNVLKKFAAAALAAATVMSSMSVMAFAADAETGTTEEKGSVTITKYMGDAANDYEDIETNYGASHQESGATEKLKDVKFAYIEVGNRVQVEVNENSTRTTEMLYTLSDDAATELGISNSADVIDGETSYYRMSTLDEAIGKHKKDVIKLVKNSKNKVEQQTGTDGKVVFDNLGLEKLYLFAETDASAAKKLDGTAVAVTKVSVPFFVSLPFTDAKGNSVTNIYAYPKNSTGNVSIDKKIDKVEDTPVGDIKANANIGDSIIYKVKYSVPVPENGLTELKIVDTMDKGLTFTDSVANITVKDDKVGATNTEKELSYDSEYTVNLDETNNIVTIDFKNYLKSLQLNSTEEFTITYKVKLNENAVLGQKGNKNKVELQYEYENNGTTIDKKVPGNDTTVFTYGINLLKKGEGTNTGLEGVKFELTDSENQPVKVLKKETNEFYTPGGTSNEVTTATDGKIYIRGLKPGTYKLTETKTKAGYVLLKDPVEIMITQKEAESGIAEATVGRKPVTMQNDQKNSDSKTAEVPLTVVNSKGFDLPATGGRGIALFTSQVSQSLQLQDHSYS